MPESRTDHELAWRPGDDTPLQMFDRTVAERGDRPLLLMAGASLSARRTADLVDRLAAGLAGLGIGRGDRVALYLQNDPQFVVGMLAIWRLGAIAVPCNPMLRARELRHHLADAGAAALIALRGLHEENAREALADRPIPVVLTDPDDLDADAPAGPAGARDVGDDVHELLELLRTADPAAAPRTACGPEDPAVITYTSGTTGPPKGAIATHANIAWASRVYRRAFAAGPADVVLGIAPLYHVTGLTGHIGVTLAAGCSLVLTHRFDAEAAARLTEQHGATVTIAAITAFLAISNDDGVRHHDLSSLRVTLSGGAPIPPAAVRSVREAIGTEIRPVYGLTETTGPTHIAPAGVPVPVHAATGALSVGLAVPGTRHRILDADGAEVATGEVGEVAITGPQVAPGYWERPDETAHAFRGGELHTGDVGVVDDDGWLYLVDRSKDMIVASGFKVWPREVEDVLYEHDAVREAAVVGMPDEYRGETVWAYVSLRPGRSTDEAALIAHCKTRLAAYKYPRVVRIVEELPKTPTGKILRRELRGGTPRIADADVPA
jgi:long-chain acyl-CoA synthetase